MPSRYLQGVLSAKGPLGFQLHFRDHHMLLPYGWHAQDYKSDWCPLKASESLDARIPDFWKFAANELVNSVGRAQRFFQQCEVSHPDYLSSICATKHMFAADVVLFTLEA